MTPDDLKARTTSFAVRVVKLCRTLPQTPEARQISEQLIAASTSIGANYRVVCRARSPAEFIAKLGIAVEEAEETVGWLELLIRLELGPSPELSWLLGESKELLAILAASQLTAKRNHQAKSKR